MIKIELLLWMIMIIIIFALTIIVVFRSIGKKTKENYNELKAEIEKLKEQLDNYDEK